MPARIGKQTTCTQRAQLWDAIVVLVYSKSEPKMSSQVESWTDQCDCMRMADRNRPEYVKLDNTINNLSFTHSFVHTSSSRSIAMPRFFSVSRSYNRSVFARSWWIRDEAQAVPTAPVPIMATDLLLLQLHVVTRFDVWLRWDANGRDCLRKEICDVQRRGVVIRSIQALWAPPRPSWAQCTAHEVLHALMNSWGRNSLTVVDEGAGPGMEVEDRWRSGPKTADGRAHNAMGAANGTGSALGVSETRDGARLGQTKLQACLCTRETHRMVRRHKGT